MKVASDKLMDLVLALCVQILKLVQVPLDIQTIGGQQIWFSLDEMFTLNSCYLAKNGNVHVKSAKRESNDKVKQIFRQSAMSHF